MAHLKKQLWVNYHYLANFEPPLKTTIVVVKLAVPMYRMLLYSFNLHSQCDEIGRFIGLTQIFKAFGSN